MSTQKREEGIVHIVLILIIVAVVGAVGYITWTLLKHNSNTPNVATNTAAQSSCMAAYHDDNLCKFASHTSLDKVAYTAALKVTQTDGTNSTTTLQSDGKGNTALTGSSNGQQLNSITLNGVTYIQTNGTGPWTKYATNAPTTDPTTNMNLSIGTAGITFKSLGTEACGSLTCYKYQVTSAASPAATQYVWFDNSSYLMRRWQYTDPSSGTTDMTINYQAVTITQPSPVQDLPTGQ